MALTSDDDGSGSFNVFTNTAISTTVLRLAFSDDEFQGGSTLVHLVFFSVGQHIVFLLPQHWSVWFGQLTAECHPFALLHLDILQFLDKFNRPF